jgi:hypothetical protein
MLGINLASEEVKKERMEICEKCEHFTKLFFCDECGCFMPVKTGLENKTCPLGKW